MTSAPLFSFVDCSSLVISKLYALNAPFTVHFCSTLSSLLIVTGPSNWDKIRFDLPPSTVSLSLIVTSSNTTLNLEGSCPVTVGIGASNVLSLPVEELTLLLPIKKSPSLFIPV